MFDQSEGVADETYRIECQRRYTRGILKNQQSPRKKKRKKEIRLKSDKAEIKNAPTPHEREAQTEPK